MRNNIMLMRILELWITFKCLFYQTLFETTNVRLVIKTNNNVVQTDALLV